MTMETPAMTDIAIGLNASGTRSEFDSMGEVAVPADRYWGPQTERARALFRIGDARLDPGVIRATGLQKWASAEANRRRPISW